MSLVDAIRARDPLQVKACLEAATDRYKLVNTPAGELGRRFFPLLCALWQIGSVTEPCDKANLEEIIRVLKEAGANCNEVVCYETALSQAVLSFPHLVKCLVEEHAADLNVPEAHSVLWLAALENNTELYAYLLAKGARPDLPDGTGKTLLERAKDWPASCRMPAAVAHILHSAEMPSVAVRITGFPYAVSSESIVGEPGPSV